MISLNVNGKRVQADAEADTPLLWVLRDYLDMTGTKFGCGMRCAARARCTSTASPCAAASRPLPQLPVKK